MGDVFYVRPTISTCQKIRSIISYLDRSLFQKIFQKYAQPFFTQLIVFFQTGSTKYGGMLSYLIIAFFSHQIRLRRNIHGWNDS